MEKIISLENKHAKLWKKLKNKKNRLKYKLYLLEGWHLVEEAINDYNVKINCIFGTDIGLKNHQGELPNDVQIIEINQKIADSISDVITNQGIFAEVILNYNNELPDNLEGPWLLLDNIQDPGNIGTMVRTADAAGFEGVIFGDGTVDQYNPKVVRSMQGSQFHLKIIKNDLHDSIKVLHKYGYEVYGSKLDPKATNYQSISKKSQFGLIMGNEGNGMQNSLGEQTDANLYIPILGRAESLNVAVAAGILMFQLMKDSDKIN